MKRLLCMTVLALLVPATAKAMTVQQAIARVFGNSRMARCISWHESHYRRFAVSPSHDFGEFQIHDSWFGHVVRWARGPRGYRRFYVQRRWIFDPLYNAKVAYVISHGGRDWRPWTTLRYCA